MPRWSARGCSAPLVPDCGLVWGEHLHEGDDGLVSRVYGAADCVVATPAPDVIAEFDARIRVRLADRWVERTVGLASDPVRKDRAARECKPGLGADPVRGRHQPLNESSIRA